MTKSYLTGNPKISVAQQHVRAADILRLPQRLIVLILFFLERLKLRLGETVRCGEAHGDINLGVTPSRRLTNRCTEESLACLAGSRHVRWSLSLAEHKNMNDKTTRSIRDVRGGFSIPVVGQVIFLILNLGTFDHGVSFKLCIAAVIAHWLIVGMIAVRRKNDITRFDAVIIRFGFFLFLPAIHFAFDLWIKTLK